MFSKFPFLVFSLGALLCIALVAFFSDKQIVNHYQKELSEDLKINLNEVATLMQNEFQLTQNNLIFLHKTPPISGLIRATAKNGTDPLDGTTTEQWKNRLAQIFISFIESNPSCFQLRILDHAGMEILRVEELTGKITRLADNDLQDKSNRYYFEQTALLSENQMFISRIDLNRDYDEITFPYKPTIRFSKPIYDDQNQFYGVLIMNVDMSLLLSSLDHVVTEKFGLIITDSDGFFVKHFDQSLRYSRDLSPDKTVETTYQKDTTNIKDTLRYAAGDAIWWGRSKPLTLVSGGTDSQLIATILLPNSTYTNELFQRRMESLLSLGVMFIIAAIALYLLNRNNVRLRHLLVKTEETQAAVDVAEDAIITVNKEWQINSVNRAFERMFLVHSDDIHKQSLPDFLAHVGDENIAKLIDSPENQPSQFRYTWRYSPTSGIKRWLQTKVVAVQAKKSNAAYAIVISDVTSEREAIDQVEAANKDLEKTIDQRTAELKEARDKALEVSDLKTNFISTISHEIRTPLNGIVGATSLLKTEPLEERQIKLVQMAENSVDALRRLVNDVLDLSKIEAGKLELNYRHFSPEALIESISSTMSVVAYEKQLSLYIDTNKLRFTQIYSDPHRLTQILNNLLNNAIKFTPRGSVTVKAWSDIKSPVSYLHIEVADTGVGISESQQQKLFNSFSQADKSIAAEYGGTGLGLSICREILTLLGGDISVKSAANKGAVFAFKIPIEQWQVKVDDGPLRLANQKVGCLIDNPGLLSNVKDLVCTNGGEITALSTPLQISVMAHFSILFLDAEYAEYEQFKILWNAAPESQRSHCKLIVLSKLSQPVSDLPSGAINLIKPLYRSVFLSTILNKRKGIPPETLSSFERRGTDVIELSNQSSIKNCRVLIVDDNEINTQVARYILEPAEFTIANASNGQLAIDRLLSSKETFNIVLMDCNMPVMNGYDATTAIRQGKAGDRYKLIPIIAMTANAMKGESEKCYEAGMNDYITKPVDPALLIGKINSLCEQDNNKQIQSPDKNTGAMVHSNNTNVTPTSELWQKETALMRLGGREALLGQLIQLFIKSSDTKLKSLTNAFATQDREQVRFEAHSLKGNCGDVGAVALHERFSELEKLAESADFAELEVLFDDIKALMNTTLKLFSAYVAEQK